MHWLFTRLNLGFVFIAIILTHTLPTHADDYHAPAWLPGGNLQTLYPYLFISPPKVDYRRERWELPDGDFLDLDWVDNPDSAPLVVLFHGLEGNSGGFYALALMDAVKQRRRGAAWWCIFAAVRASPIGCRVPISPPTARTSATF
jgi:Predicted hydrolase of the alpha/beta-hydrolase fold